jgi:hypothetical protein
MRKFTILFVIIFAAAAAGFSQEASKSVTQKSDAQKAFEKLKSLAGSWQGSIMGIPISFTVRATSSGTTILHEGNTTKGPTPDHELTIFYVEGGRLLATHYCDADNRVSLAGKMSTDGKNIEFSFRSVEGGTSRGVVKRMKFTMVDPNKHLVEFTFVMPDGKAVELNGEFQRTN